MLRLGDIVVDERRGELRRGTEVVKIEPLVLRLITYLAANSERVVSKDMLIEELWDGRVISDSAVTRAVSLGRKALATPACPNPIRSVYGKGYQLSQEVGVLDQCREVCDGTQVDRRDKPVTLERFIGRVSELASLRGAIERLKSGTGAVHLVTGDPGIGKTRLCEEAVAYAVARGLDVRLGRCSESDGVPSFWPWLQILRDSQGWAPRRSGPSDQSLQQRLVEASRRAHPTASPRQEAQDRFQLFDAVTDFLRQELSKRPMVIVIDDLHRADQASLELLSLVATELSPGPLLVIAAYRDLEARKTSLQRRTLAELTRSTCAQHHPLAGLSRSEVAQLVDGTSLPAVLADVLHDATAGNPLFVRHLLEGLSHLDESSLRDFDLERVATVLPAGVKDAIGLQLDGMSPRCKETLAAASVVGRDFSIVDLHVATGTQLDELLEIIDEATEQRIVCSASVGDSRYRFSHVLIRDYLYESLGSAARSTRHMRLAVGMADRHRVNPGLVSATIAHHAREALPIGEADFAVEWSRRAGDFASTQFAYEEAAWQFEQGLDAQASTGLPNDDLECKLLLDLSEARIRAGDREGASESCRRAVEIARSIRSPDLVARAALAMTPGFFSIETALYDEQLIELLQEALESVGSSDARMRARLLGRLATALYWSDHVERRRDLSEEAVRLVEGDHDDDTVAYALYAWHCALWGPENVFERTKLAQRATRLTERSGDREANLLYRMVLMTDLAEVGDVAQFDVEVERFSRTASELQQAQSLWLVPMFWAMRALMEGRFADVVALSTEIRAIGGRIKSEDAENCRAGQVLLAMFETGQGDQMLRLLRSHIEEHPKVLLFRSVPPWVAAELGYTVEAREGLAEFASTGFTNIPRDMNWLGTIGFLALACAELRDRDSAEVLMGLLGPFKDRFAVLGHATVTLGAVASHLGRLASICGDWERASEYFRAGREMNESAGALPWVARSLHDEGFELALRGDADRAAVLLRRAEEIACQLGMAHLLRLISASRATLKASVADDS